MTTRRSFLAAIAALPFVRNLLPRTEHVKDCANFETVTIKSGGTIISDRAVTYSFTLRDCDFSTTHFSTRS